MDQRSKPYFFAFDTDTKPGMMICHSIRIETIEIPMDKGGVFDNTMFTVFPADYYEDKRLRDLVQSAYSFVKNNNIEL